MKRFLIRHLGNMGDMVFFIPPILASLKKQYPDSHITFLAPWGFKDKQGRWGKRNQGGFSLHLLMTDPHIDQLIHWHDTRLSLGSKMCHEDGRSFPTWSKAYYQKQKESKKFNQVFELDFGLTMDDNPITRMYEMVGLPKETFSNTKIYLTSSDKQVAHEVMRNAPRPRIMLLEGLAGTPTRNWDWQKIPALEQAIRVRYGVSPLWFGAAHTPDYQGRPLTLRENIALLSHADVAIGVLSGPLHFATAVGLPTLALYCDHPLHRAAPAYFLNQYRSDPAQPHRTLLGPVSETMQMLKSERAPASLTPAEVKRQNYRGWNNPGRQATKSCLAAITVDEIMRVLEDMW